jgi:hypothetical protein
VFRGLRRIDNKLEDGQMPGHKAKQDVSECQTTGARQTAGPVLATGSAFELVSKLTRSAGISRTQDGLERREPQDAGAKGAKGTRRRDESGDGVAG